MERDPVVRTTAGPVAGRTAGDVHEFLGVPYAAAPTGPLRFAAPQRPEAWGSERPAVQPGPTAPQVGAPGLGAAGLVAGDDHLHVNVFTPTLGPDRLPVLVWIHGGGWVIGSNADPTIHGARLARRGIVVVSVNYRLGVDGFLALRDAPLNRAVLDWLLALEWVQENVAAFGGDPGRVTVGGHSAGSAATLILSTLPQARGLFRRSFAMSGVPWNLPPAEDGAREATAFAARLGVDLTAPAIASVDRARLLEVQHEVAPLGGVAVGADPLEQFHRTVTVPFWLGPVVDGDLIAEHPMGALRKGASGDRELLIGSIAEELDILVSAYGDAIGRSDAEAALTRVGLSPEGAARWCDVEGMTPAQALGAALTTLSFRSPVLQVVEARRASPARTFLYETTWRPPTPYGAVHSLDVPFAFGNLDAPGIDAMAGGEPPQSLADDMAGALARFVVDGDPGWAPYTEDRSSMCFDVPSRTALDADALVREVFLAHAPRSTRQ